MTNWANGFDPAAHMKAQDKRIAVLTTRLHDAEAEREERERHLAVSLEATRNWAISYEVQRDARIVQENRAEAAESALTAAHARIAALESLVANLADYNHVVNHNHGDWRECPMATCSTAARALFSPAPAEEK